MINTIYLDMDGVITDFDRGYRFIFGKNCRDDPDESHWTSFVKIRGFANLEYMKGAEKLLAFLSTLDANIEILSCTGHRGDQEDVALQKTEWLLVRGYEFNRNYTLTKAAKADYANPNSLIIDDSEACVSPFIQNGGHGILHVSAENTIAQLQSMIDEGLLCVRS